MPLKLRWGIVSAGKISHDFCVALSTLHADEHEIVAVAARSKERAVELAKAHNIPHSFGNYEGLAEFKGADIVYIGALNPLHFQIAYIMLKSGKHVLCEKPLCLTYSQTCCLIKYAELKKLFLMEGVWSRFFPTYQYLKKQIDIGRLGEIQSVELTFGFLLEDVERLQKNELGGGVVLDLGIYGIQCSQWAFREPPIKVVANGELNDDGVDIDVHAELHYDGGRVAKFHLSAKEQLENKATIKGSKGEITLIDFWCPTKIIDIDGREKEWILPKAKNATNYFNSEGLRYEAMAARDMIMENKIQHDDVSHNDSILFAQIEAEMLKQLGVVYKDKDEDQDIRDKDKDQA